MTDLELYKNIKDKNLQKENIFIGEGRYVVERMIAVGCEIFSVLCTPGNAGYFKKLANNKFPVIEKTKEELTRITGFKFHRGVLAAAQRPLIPDLKTFLTNSPNITTLVILPSLSEAENIGGIIRSATAFSLDGVLMGPECIDPFSRKAIRCSMGSVFAVPLAIYTRHKTAITILRESGFHIIGTTPSVSGKPLNNFHFPKKTALVFGQESEGLIPPWDSSCDTYLQIRISDKLDSLNVGVAAGIFFYEFSKLKYTQLFRV